MLVEFWSHPNPIGNFNGEPERAKMAAKPPFFASDHKIQNFIFPNARVYAILGFDIARVHCTNIKFYDIEFQ